MRRVLAAAAILAAIGGTATAVNAGSDNSANGGRPLATTLTPEAEVAPFVGVDGASGEVSMSLNPGRQQICVDMTTSGFDLVLAHIHEGAVGANGGVVVDFTGLINGANASGCVSVDRSVIRDIVRDPGNYYVNVHRGVPSTGADPDPFFQAIRGQLGR